jgi:hypothetical protein
VADLDPTEHLLLSDFPELARPHASLMLLEGGAPGGQIVFEMLFATFIEILLAMPKMPLRDLMVERAFRFIEAMLGSPAAAARGLASTCVLEGRDAWWVARAHAFLGPLAAAELARKHGGALPKADADPDPEREIIDLYGVRDAILARDHELTPERVPGISAPRAWERLLSLVEAQRDPLGAIFLACSGTSTPLVICSAAEVRCSEPALTALSRILAARLHRQPSSASVTFVRLWPGERVWAMDTGESRHGRWRGLRWIDPRLSAVNLDLAIGRALVGE